MAESEKQFQQQDLQVRQFKDKSSYAVHRNQTLCSNLAPPTAAPLELTKKRIERKLYY